MSDQRIHELEAEVSRLKEQRRVLMDWLADRGEVVHIVEGGKMSINCVPVEESADD